jgi:hypothetical protein
MLHKTLVCLLCCLAFHARAGAPPSVPSAERVGFERLRESDLRADLSFIASDPLLGRMSLQPGDEVAAQWVAAEFAKAGLAPAAQDPLGRAGFLQSVPLVEYRADNEASYLAVRRGNDMKHWRAPELIGAFRDAVDVSAQVVFAGYGISAPGLDYDDYRGIDARGRIVVVFEHEPQETDPRSRFNGTGNTRYATNRVKALNAQAHGALALLVMGEPNRQHPSNLERYNRIGGSATRLVPLPGQALIGDELKIPVLTLSDALGAELLAGAAQTPAALQAAIDGDLSNHSCLLNDTLVTLHLENKTRITGITFNVAGWLKGSDPTLSAETVIVSAHHDHDGSSIAAGGGTDIWHGADDNGSGTVGVVALARAFAVNPTRPKRSLLFVVFGAEERGLLGSYYMAAHPLRPLEGTRAMINFDMIGRNEAPSEQTNGLIDIPADTANRLNLIGGAYSPDYKATVQDANRAIGLVLDDRFDHENALNSFFRSDQFPFVLHDIPAFWFFTGFHPDYHHTSDTADKINYPKMLKILKLAYLSAWTFATEERPPRFIADPPGSSP